MKSIHLAVLFVVVLGISGCALDPVRANDVINEAPVNAARVKFNNLADNRTDGGNEVYTSDFQPLPSDATDPAFPVLVAQSLRQSTNATGNGANIEVDILRADILVKSRVVDSIVFVGIISAVNPRDHRCEVDVLIDTGHQSHRVTLRSTSELSLSWRDVSNEDRRAFVEDCIAGMHSSLMSELEEI